MMIPPFWVFAIVLGFLAYKRVGKGFVAFTVIGIFFIENLYLWEPTMLTLAMIITATSIAILLGLPLGILSAKFEPLSAVMRPILDFMQTMPAFVHLIPAVLLFGLGEVPAVISTIVFSIPPVIRLTELGIRQVPKELIEAANRLVLCGNKCSLKIQLLLAMPTIMAGINQCIMLSLSMVVIASMIGAEGLGNMVVSGVSNMKSGMAFEGGIGVVILAIVIDRLTQGKNLKRNK